MATIRRSCSCSRRRSTDAEEVRDDDDDRDDQKNVDQPTGCRYGDKPEEPQHQDHACNYEQHIRVPPFFQRLRLADCDSSPRTILLRDGSVMAGASHP